jgi:tetratricopeptide (TPR) repeat protein
MQDTAPVPAAPRTKKGISFDLLALFALAATVVLALIVVTFSPSVSFLGTKTLVIMGGTLVSLALFVIGRLTRGNIVVPPTFLTLSLWFVPAAYALSTLFSGVSPSLAFFGTEFETDTFGFVLTLSVVATLVALVIRREREQALFVRVVAWAYGAVLVLQTLLVLVARFAPSIIAPLSNFIGSFSDLGMLVGLGVIVSLLGLRFLSLPGRSRVILWVGIALGYFLLALANSPAIWVLVSLTALGLFIEALLKRQKMTEDASELEGVSTLSIDSEESASETRPLGPPLITLVIAVFFLIGGSTIGNALSSMMNTSFIDVRPSWQSTFEVGSHVYASSPLFGSGPETFSSEWGKFRDRTINNTVFWSIDFSSGVGYIPTSMVATGILGALAWLAFLGLFLFIGVRALLFRLPKERYVRFTSVASFAAAVYVFTLGIFATPGPVVLFAGFVAAGLFISTLRYGRERVEWGIAFSKAPRIGFVLVFAFTILLLISLFTGYVVVKRYVANLAYGEAVTALSNGNLDAADAAVARSVALAPTDRAYRLAAASDVARMNEIASSEALSPTEAQQQFQTALSAAVSAAVAATQRGPDNYQNWLALGGVYQSVVPLKITGAFDAAKDAYAKAAALAPSNPTIPYTLAQLDIANGDAVTAQTDLLAAIALKQDYTQAILLYSQLQIQLGKANEALQAVESAIYFAPNDPATLFEAGILRLGTGDKAGAIQALSHAVTLNPQYANARYFLAVAEANSGDTAAAIKDLQAVAALSDENAKAVDADLTALQGGQNPWPASRLKTLGVPFAPVEEPSDTAATKGGTPAKETTAPEKK